MTLWQTYNNKFSKVTPREQYLIALTGAAVIVFVIYNFVLSAALDELSSTQEKSRMLRAENNTLIQTQSMYEEALTRDPNSTLNSEISKYKKKLASIDEELLTLTSGLINPVQMRLALLELLNVEKGVVLRSFELVDVEKIGVPSANGSDEVNLSNPLGKGENDFVLYKHGIRLKLTGQYFQLKEYLSKLESLKWRFFWEEFNYNLTIYPDGELGVTMYSLSTQREFIGV